MSRGRLSFNLQNEEAMKQFNRLFKEKYAKRYAKGMGENKEPESGVRNMRPVNKIPAGRPTRSAGN